MNIMKVYCLYVDNTNNKAYYLMEYIPYKNIFYYLEKSTKF